MTAGTAPGRDRPLLAGMRRVLLVGGGFVLLAGLALSVRPDHSDHDFAWTIRPPLTAAFLGACYLSSCLIAVLAASQSTWARARIAVPAVLSFSLLTLAATLLHLGRFHLHGPGVIARGTAWAWLGIYVAVPTALLVLLPVSSASRAPTASGWRRCRRPCMAPWRCRRRR